MEQHKKLIPVLCSRVFFLVVNRGNQDHPLFSVNFVNNRVREILCQSLVKSRFRFHAEILRVY